MDISLLRDDFSKFRARLDKAQGRISRLEDKQIIMDEQVKEHTVVITEPNAKTQKQTFTDRNRSTKIRIVGFPKGVEGTTC